MSFDYKKAVRRGGGEILWCDQDRYGNIHYVFNTGPGFAFRVNGSDGRRTEKFTDSPDDLIMPHPPITSKWVNVYFNVTHQSEQACKVAANLDTVGARLRLDFEGESLKDVEIVWRKS